MEEEREIPERLLAGLPPEMAVWLLREGRAESCCQATALAEGSLLSQAEVAAGEGRQIQFPCPAQMRVVAIEETLFFSQNSGSLSKLFHGRKRGICISTYGFIAWSSFGDTG